MKIDGTKVVDAVRRIVIEINRRDVIKGAGKDPGGCAAALACLRQIKGVKAARVHIGRTYLKFQDEKTGRTKWVRFRTPLALRTEIVSFDRAGVFEPGKYELQTVQKTARLGTRRPRYEKSRGPRHGKPQGRRSRAHQVEGIRAHGPWR